MAQTERKQPTGARSVGRIRDLGRLLALGCCLALAASFVFVNIQRTLAAQFALTKNTVNSVTTSVLFSPTGLTGSRSANANTLTWTAASPMNGGGYAISGVNNGASSTCPSLASAYTTYVGSTAGTSFTDSGTLATGTAGTYVCYLVRTGYSAAGGPPWASVPTWTSSNTLPTVAVLLTAAVPIPTLIQSKKAASAPTVTTLSTTWTSATVAGRLLVAVIGRTSTSAVLTMPAGWVAGPASSAAGAGVTTIYYYPNAPSFAAGSSVTATWSTVTSGALVISEWSNVVAAAPLDAKGTATGTALSSSVSTTAPTAQSGELALAGVYNGATASAETFAPGAGWIDVANTGATASATLDVIYQVQAVAGTATATDNWTVSGAYTTAIATFKHS